MSVYACLGSDAAAIRDAFLTRLQSKIEDMHICTYLYAPPLENIDSVVVCIICNIVGNILEHSSWYFSIGVFSRVWQGGVRLHTHV